MRYDSKVLHTGVEFDERTGAVSVPIYQVSTFRQKGVGEHSGYEYSRSGNPTREALEKAVAELEGGARGLAYASGLAAITGVLMLFRAGDHLVVSDDVYGGTFRVLDKVFNKFGLKVAFVNTSELTAVEQAIQEDTKAIFIETPTNPTLKVTDIKLIAEIAKKHNLLLIADNTFLTPYWQRPLELGADIVLHSGTKYLGGHSDLIAGVVIAKSEELGEKLHFLQNATGGVLGPFDSWLLMRGLKTLAVRMEKHEENARKLAEWLKNLPQVKKVYYPGLADHPGHELAKTQAAGFGGTISFELESPDQALSLLRNVKMITLAESLGGVESLISLPAQMTHASIPPERRQEIGVSDSLVRLSVGIENVEDLKEDILAGLAE